MSAARGRNSQTRAELEKAGCGAGVVGACVESEFEKAGTPRTPFSPAAGPSFFACGDPGEGHSVPLRARVSR